MAKFLVKEFISEQGILILDSPEFDFDSFLVLGEALLVLLSAKLIEQQQDADLHTWLIDFEGQHFFLKAEHYSQTMWLEALAIEESRENMLFIAKFIAVGLV
jgi:membrane-associated PAP2 superfamily phosphatase